MSVNWMRRFHTLSAHCALIQGLLFRYLDRRSADGPSTSLFEAEALTMRSFSPWFWRKWDVTQRQRYSWDSLSFTPFNWDSSRRIFPLLIMQIGFMQFFYWLPVLIAWDVARWRISKEVKEVLHNIPGEIMPFCRRRLSDGRTMVLHMNLLAKGKMSAKLWKIWK